jgi:hypothetical protein
MRRICFTPQRTALATVLLATIVLATACGGGSGGQETSNTTPTVANTSRPTTTTAPIVLQVNKDVWYAGYQFHLATATIDTVGAVARQMVIEMTAENQGPEAATPDLSDVALVTPDGSVAPDTRSPWKTIPAGGKANAEVVFTVEDAYVPGKDTVIFGTTAVQQAKVPLGTGSAVSLEPHVVTELGALAAGTLTLVLTAATVRADIPDRHTQQDAHRWTLSVDFTATYSGTAGGGYLLLPTALTAKAPNGTSAVAEPTAVRNASYALKSGVAETGTWRFTVDEPPAGAYRLTLTSSEGDPEPTSSLTLLAT